MAENANNIVELSAVSERSDSFSTVNSSFAAADIARQIENLRNSKAVNPTIQPAIQPTDHGNMKFENVESLNIVYNNNFYNHSSTDGK
jgi:hypothetical protein